MTSKRDWKPRAVGQPEAGYFLIRLVRKGPLIPARIVLRDGMWWAMINGSEYPAASDPAAAPRVFQIWHGGEVITEKQYNKALAKSSHPDALDPNKPIDLTKLPSIF